MNTKIKGFWNGELADFRVVVGIVGDEPAELKKQIEGSRPGMKRYLWFVPFIGQQRQMVEVKYQGETFYLDNSDGTGLHKVTSGKGSPRVGHKSVYPSSISHEVPREQWQECTEFVCEIVKEEIDEMWTALDPIGYPAHKKQMDNLMKSMPKF